MCISKKISKNRTKLAKARGWQKNLKILSFKALLKNFAAGVLKLTQEQGKNMLKKLIFFTSLLFLPFAIFSAEINETSVVRENQDVRTISYSDALAILKSDSADYKVAEINKRISNRTAVSSAAGMWIPSISLSSNLVSVSGSDGRTENFSTTTLGPDFSASLNLGINATNIINFISMDIQKALAEFSYDQTIKSLEKALFSTYWGLASALDAYKTGQETYEYAKKTLENTEAKYNAGLASSLDLMNARLTFAKQESSLISLENTVENTYLTLKAMLNVKEDFNIEESRGVAFVDLPETMDLYNKYLSSNNTIKQLQLTYDTSKTSYDALNYGSRIPSFNARLAYGYSHKEALGTGGTGYYNSLNFGITASLGLDGFIPGTTTFKNIQNAKDNTEIAKLNLDKGYNTYRQSIESYINTIENAESSYVSSLNQAEYAEESYRLSEDAYNNGKISMQEFSNALNTYLQAKVSVLNNSLTYSNAVYSLANYLGVDYDTFIREYGRESAPLQAKVGDTAINKK